MDRYIKLLIKNKQIIFFIFISIGLSLLFRPNPIKITDNPDPFEQTEVKEGYEDTKSDSASKNGDSNNKVNENTTQSLNSSTNKTSNYIYVDLRGAVKKPNIYQIESSKRLNDLINLAGGLENANNDCINLAQTLTDGTRIDIPYKEQDCNLTEQTSSNLQAQGSQSNEPQSSNMVNINTATSEELQTLTGIGEGKANTIITYREENGPFKTIEDIKNVSGIGESSFEKIKDSICI